MYFSGILTVCLGLEVATLSSEVHETGAGLTGSSFHVVADSCMLSGWFYRLTKALLPLYSTPSFDRSTIDEIYDPNFITGKVQNPASPQCIYRENRSFPKNSYWSWQIVALGIFTTTSKNHFEYDRYDRVFHTFYAVASVLWWMRNVGTTLQYVLWKWVSYENRQPSLFPLNFSVKKTQRKIFRRDYNPLSIRESSRGHKRGVLFSYFNQFRKGF